VILVAVMGLFFTTTIFIQSLNWEKGQVEIEFREASQDRVLVVQRGIKYAISIVEDIASFIEASEVVGRREFRKFVGPALKRQAGVKALEWVPVVPYADRSSFVDQARHSFPPFVITEVDSSGNLIESHNRPVYYPVLYVQPYDTNKELLGLNLGADPVLSALLHEAELSRTLQVSDGVTIKDESGERMGFIAAIPVFFKSENVDPETVQSPPKLRGFAVGIFVIGDIVEQSLKSLRSGGIDLLFYQGPLGEAGSLLYLHLSRLREDQQIVAKDDSSGMSYSQEILVGDKQWQVISSPTPGKYRTDTWGSWIVLLGGIAFTALFSTYVSTLVGRSRQVKLEVKEKTSQLREAIQALNREVIERKSAEQQLKSLNETLEEHVARRTEEAERRAQYLEQFAYVTSHDLKAPLRAVSNLAQWIEEDLSDKLDNASRDQLALLRDRVRRMHDLIEGLLEYSRVGKTNDPVTRVDTGELVEEVIDSLSPPKGFEILVQGDMPIMYADRLQLGQVFANLIGNSLKHHGGKTGKVWVTGEIYGDIYQFSVKDDGKGIAPQYHEKIFMIFQSLEPSDFESSTGIGLALVKKIVEEHGGIIRIKSDVGEGTCFYFTWPKRRSSRSELGIPGNVERRRNNFAG